MSITRAEARRIRERCAQMPIADLRSLRDTLRKDLAIGSSTLDSAERELRRRSRQRGERDATTVHAAED